MPKTALVARLACREIDLRSLARDIMDDVQTTPGDELSRALRHVADLVIEATEKMRQASDAASAMGDW